MVIPNAENLQGIGNDHSLLAVIGMRDALICPQPVKCRGSTWSLVWHHATDGPPEDLGGGTVVEGALLWVGVHPLAPELGKLQLVSEEGARDVDVLSANADHLLTIEELLCNSG